jgi:uroporphyrinogen decarboxylase
MADRDILDKEIDFLKERILTRSREVDGITPLERVGRFFQGNPEKVPLGFFLADEWSAHYRGFKIGEVSQEAKKLVVSHLNLCARFGLDFWAMTFPSYYLIGPSAVGSELRVFEDHTPMMVDPVVKSPGDLEDLTVPDMRNAGFMPYYWEAYRTLKERLNDIYPASMAWTLVGHPFDFASQLRGANQLFMETRTNPGFVKHLCDFSADCIIEIGKIFKEDIGISTLFLSGATVGKMSAEDFLEFDFPYTCKIQEALEPYGIRVSVFIFTDFEIVEAIVDAGMTLLGLPQPVIFSTNYWRPEKGWFPSDEDLIRDREEAESRGWPLFVFFLGQWLQSTSPNRIEKRIRRAVELVGPSVPIWPTSLPVGVPIENVDAYVQAMRKYAVSEQ